MTPANDDGAEDETFALARMVPVIGFVGPGGVVTIVNARAWAALHRRAPLNIDQD